MRRLLPDSVAGRIVLVLLVGLTVSHLASMALYYAEGTEALSLLGQRRVAERIAMITRLVDNTRPAETVGILEIVDSPGVRVTLSDALPLAEGGQQALGTDLLEHLLSFQLGERKAASVRVWHFDDPLFDPLAFLGAGRRPLPDDHLEAMGRHMGGMMADAVLTGSIRVSVQLSDSTWLNFAVPHHATEPFSSLRFILSMSLMVLAVLALSVWAVRHLTSPLARFARAAERIGMDVDAPRLPETGPREVRRATRAFNEMQDRIRRFVEDRTQMLAAIAHDLRTPITRLRLRAELVEDEEQSKILADLDEMERMIASTLSFARDDASQEPQQNVDLFALLHSVCDDMADAGFQVEFLAEGRLAYDCRPDALRRAFTNLIENAVKYGHRARLSLDLEENAIRVTIDDDGPGIPEECQEEVFSPFRRLEDSRSRETGGTGLGLTVARAVARAHGGDVSLGNRPGGGLRVEFALPLGAVRDRKRATLEDF